MPPEIFFSIAFCAALADDSGYFISSLFNASTAGNTYCRHHSQPNDGDLAPDGFNNAEIMHEQNF
jgi:hypothetical protein